MRTTHVSWHLTHIWSLTFQGIQKVPQHKCKTETFSWKDPIEMSYWIQNDIDFDIMKSRISHYLTISKYLILSIDIESLKIRYIIRLILKYFHEKILIFKSLTTVAIFLIYILSKVSYVCRICRHWQNKIHTHD